MEEKLAVGHCSLLIRRHTGHAFANHGIFCEIIYSPYLNIIYLSFYLNSLICLTLFPESLRSLFRTHNLIQKS